MEGLKSNEGDVGAALVAAHGNNKKFVLPVGGHKGGPYIGFVGFIPSSIIISSIRDLKKQISTY